PSHAMYWECLDQMGWSERVDDGKRCLVQLATSACAKQVQTAGADPLVRIWDFSGFEGPAGEPIPVESSPIYWHADPVHFTRPLGNLIISQVTGDLPAGPGRLLTAENLDAHLASWRDDLQQYMLREQKARQLADTDSQVVWK